jgi:hypothetical protein
MDGCAATTRRTVMKLLFKNLMNDESGQDLIEYANEFNAIGSSL